MGFMCIKGHGHHIETHFFRSGNISHPAGHFSAFFSYILIKAFKYAFLFSV